MSICLDSFTGGIGTEIILMLIDSDRTHSDPVKNLRGCYKQGDIESVERPNANHGNLAEYPIAAPWWMVRVVGVPLTVAEKYLTKTATRRRQYGVVFSDLPSSKQTDLTNDRYAVINWQSFRLALRHKDTNAVGEP